MALLSPSGYPLSQRFSPIPSSGSVPKMGDAECYLDDNISVRPSSGISSPSWPSSLSTAVSDRRGMMSKSPGAFDRVIRATEIVKSSSAGSVSKLAHKPTGIILGTPSSPQSNLTSGHVYSTKMETPHGASRIQGSSTPYPIRSTHTQAVFRRCDRTNLHDRQTPRYCPDNLKYTSAQSVSKDVRESFFRPSVAVRPMHLPQFSNEPSDRTLVQSTGVHGSSFSGPPWDRHLPLTSSESHSFVPLAGNTQSFVFNRRTQNTHYGPLRQTTQCPTEVCCSPELNLPASPYDGSSRSNFQVSSKSYNEIEGTPLQPLYSATVPDVHCTPDASHFDAVGRGYRADRQSPYGISGKLSVNSVLLWHLTFRTCSCGYLRYWAR